MHLTRRYFLQMTGALSAYLGVTPIDLFADAGASGAAPRPVREGKTLVLIFLRGGADGLNLLVPYADPFYAKARRSIVIAPPGGKDDPDRAIDLDGQFGLHPALSAWKPLFDQGLAVAAQAVGHARNTRSHFEEQDVWETGVTGNTIHSDGWVNRHLATSLGRGPIRAVGVGEALPRILHGKCPAFAISGVDELSLPEARTDQATLVGALEHAYRADARAAAPDARDLLAQAARTTLDGVAQLNRLVAKEYVPAATYPESDLGRKLMQVARLIKSNVGLEVAEVDYGGWDTHNGQGGATGYFADLARDLAISTKAFLDDLGDRAGDVLLLTLSDFGRTVAENGTQGTDHGWANCMFAFGGPVRRAGRSPVLGRWPGLAPDQLRDARDLEHTTDFRDVLAEVVRVHLDNPNLAAILPSHPFRAVGLV